jgi:hypothetical protein
MKGISLSSLYGMGSRRHWSIGAVAGAILLSGVRAEAAPIRHVDLGSTDAKVMKEWSSYLLASPSVWKEVLHPPVTAAVRSSIWESVRTDPGGADPMVHYLLWKQSLDPTRFAFYHPKLAPALEKILKATPSVPVAAQGINPTSSETSSTPSTSTEEQSLIPPVPEPSGLVLALGMAGWGIWMAHRRRSNP